MTTLNRQRANIVFSTLLESDGDLLAVSGDRDGEGRGKVPTLTLTPAQVAERELIFERDGAVKWHAPTSNPTPMPITLGTAKIGVSIHEYLCTTACTTDSDSGSKSPTLRELITLFSNEGYILSLSPPPPATGTKPEPRTGYKYKYQATILLKQACTSRDQLKAWMHAVLAMRVLSSSSSLSSGPGLGPSSEEQKEKGKGENEILPTLRRTLVVLNDGFRFEGYMRALEGCGWEVDCAVLETGGARRVSIH